MTAAVSGFMMTFGSMAAAVDGLEATMGEVMLTQAAAVTIVGSQ